MADEVKCPVDHKTREAWLSQTTTSKAETTKSSHGSGSHSQSSSDNSHPSLPTSRVISSIPRTQDHSNESIRAANNEQETGTSSSGHWIYPSERQFFAALQRKKFQANPQDMSSIVPIHNAVNERAWRQIVQWEDGWGSKACGGPKLSSFEGNSQKLSPKAWWLSAVLGYAKPFDRHDWVIDRCGKQIEYVIDFYGGKDEGIQGKPLNFYLDVRPKLNSWVGWQMRIGRFFGF